MIRNLSWLRARFSPRLRLDHDVEINEFVRERGHVVGEAEGVFAWGVCSEDVVALFLGSSVKDVFVIGVFYLEVDLEGCTGLDGKIEL